MRRVLIAVAILVLPSAVALTVFILANKKVPTDPEAMGEVSTIAGDGSLGAADGNGRAAAFADPFGIAVDRKGVLYITDGGDANRIRRITPNGIVETIAGMAQGFSDGIGRGASFNTPSGIAIDRLGNIYVADTSNNRIRKVDADRRVSTLAGAGEAGADDGDGSQARFDGPIGLAVDRRGNVFVADTYNNRIRKISPNGDVSTLAGNGTTGFSDGEAYAATFDTPSGVAVDQQGNVFVADTGNSAVRKISPQLQVTTIAARERPAEVSRPRPFTHPIGLAVTHDGFLFVSCEDGIFRIAPDGRMELYAGGRVGFADGLGQHARFNSPSGVTVDHEGNLFVADTQNHLIRMVTPIRGSVGPAPEEQPALFVQPSSAEIRSNSDDVIPRIKPTDLARGGAFPWPLAPQDQLHEIAGVVGEARGAPGGVALDHLHSGLDIRGQMGEAVLSVLDEKVSAPRPNWDFNGLNEGISVGLMSYIHVRVGRDSNDNVDASGKFKALTDAAGELRGVGVRRGTRFKVGDFLGTVNRLYHVHLNLGPWNAQANALALPLAGLKDTVPPVVEAGGIEIFKPDGSPYCSQQSCEKRDGRLLITGDVEIHVTAYDRVDGNGGARKLGLYRLGYQLLKQDGSPAPGFEQPLMNIEFNRLPADDSTVAMVYAPGSGASAYRMPTRYNYIVTNYVRDGRALRGLLRTSKLTTGNYIIRVVAEDYFGNRASGPRTELPIVIVREQN